MVDVIGSIRLVKDASNPLNMGDANVGSVYLKAVRIQESYTKQSKTYNLPKFGTNQSTGPDTFIVDPLFVQRAFNLTGILTGSPDAYVDKDRIGSMIRFGKLSMFIYNNGSYFVDFLNAQFTENAGNLDRFDYTMTLLTGSIKA